MVMRRIVHGLVAASVVFFQTSYQASAQNHGRSMPPDNGQGGSVVQQYGNAGSGSNPLTYDRPVVDTTKNIAAGDIRFDYDTYTRVGGSGGGAAFSGGFFKAPGVG